MVDKSFMFYILIIIASFYFFPKTDKIKKNYDMRYISVNNAGKEILVVEYKPFLLQKKAWNDSPLKDDFIKLFPHFEEMKAFISKRLVGEELKTYLYQKLNRLEHDFFSGDISTQKAKWLLENLQ